MNMYINNGQTMAPIAAIGEELGAEVTWIPDTKQIIVATEDQFVEVTVISPTESVVTVDGEIHSDLFVQIVNGTSYVNIGAFADAIGWEVIWDEETRSILIFS